MTHTLQAQFVVTAVRHGIVFLRDLDGRKSITNDAEAVFAYCQTNYPGLRVVYEDSYGDLTEILDKPRTTWLGTSPLSFRPYQGPV